MDGEPFMCNRQCRTFAKSMLSDRDNFSVVSGVICGTGILCLSVFSDITPPPPHRPYVRPSAPCTNGRGVQKIFKRVLAEREIEVHNGKEVVDVRDPPEGVPGGMGKLMCKDGSEVRLAISLLLRGVQICRWE